MGQRLRLKSSFVIPLAWSIEEKAILRGLKKYGAMVADNGNFFSISVTPDDRWPANAFSHLSSVGITNFEVVQSTGPNGGPRSPGSPIVTVGADQSVPLGLPIELRGVVASTGAPPVINWKLYSGPGAVNFSNPALTNSAASFSAPGTYILMLSAADGIHAVAYDAVKVTVTQALSVTIASAGTGVSLSWTGGSPPYVIERSPSCPWTSWTPVLTNNTSTVLLPPTGSTGFFRVRSN
jgi:hypothetical protein